MNNRKVILYISMSLDGYIATNDDDISWLSIAEKEGEDYGYKAFNNTVDTYIVGSKTYEVVLNLTGGVFPAAEKHQCYVITRTERENQQNITFYTQGVEKLIEELKQQEGKNIYCDGGGKIVQLLMEKHLIDEYRIFVIPTILGNGKRLFMGNTPSENIELISSKQYDTGVVELHYKRK